jgi:hypothetical protein
MNTLTSIMKTAKLCSYICCYGFFVCSLQAQTDTSAITWSLGDIDTVHGLLGAYTMTKLTQWPSIVSTPYGKAALFNGINQAVLVRCAPLGTATAFTVEVYFHPDSLVLSGTNNEQRFIHIRNAANDNRRVLMETRTFPTICWILDTYIQSDSSKLTLNDSSTTHTDGAWHHVALTYSNGIMRQYVDGIELLSGSVLYQQIDTNGNISIGARQDPRSWFKGAIKMVKISKRALLPSEFSIPTVVSVPDMATHPIEFALHQNYPNPFNPATTISFYLPRESQVRLEVFNVLGQKVVTLIDGKRAAGNYSASFDASLVSSGIYFYRLSTSTQTISKKMIVMK